MTKQEFDAWVKRQQIRSLISMVVFAAASALVAGTMTYLYVGGGVFEPPMAEAKPHALPPPTSVNSTVEFTRIEERLAELENVVRAKSEENESRQHFSRGKVVRSEAAPAVTAQSIKIRVTERSWESTTAGIRPRVSGEISMPDLPAGSRQVEFWATLSVNGESIGYDNLRVPLRNGEGSFDEVFFLQENAPNFSDQQAFDFDIDNIILLEVPDYEIEFEESETEKNPRTNMLKKSR